MAKSNRILRVAVATPLRRLFDYLPPENSDVHKVKAGIRVSVPFGRRKEIIGILVSLTDKSEHPTDKLKRINYFIDKEPVIDSKILDLCIWASRYYHHPIGEVIFNALPAWLRKGKTLDKLEKISWRLTAEGKQVDPNQLKRAPKQAQLLNFLQQDNLAKSKTDLESIFKRPETTLFALEKKGFVEKTTTEIIEQEYKAHNNPLELNKHQTSAIKNICNKLGTSSVFLLDGLTGSGKTEVYMTVIESMLKLDKQCLVLLPEIGLTPQIIQRFKDRFDCNIAIQHSGLSNTERMQHWLEARSGRAKIVLGTRSAVWTPLAKPGLYIIDEEHDLSYKQQDGFRYSAKDMLIIRASRDNVPVILGSATPSLESLYNIKNKKYEHLVLPARAGLSRPPTFHLLDIRGKKMHGPLSQTLIDEINKHLENKNQVLLFLNRRGYAVNLYCHQCGWKAECSRCELPYTYHKSTNRLNCHHCGGSKKNITHCPECGEHLLLMGHGTERIEEVLNNLFPHAVISRIDRDTTRKKGAMSSVLNHIHSGSIDIMIGTQMLAKGHHFPNVTLTAIVDADRGLFSTDFRAGERLAQLFMQVSGRTGRGEKPGTVIVQTYNPEHPLFQQLITHGYNHYSTSLLKEREHASLPPYTYMALLKAEAHNINDAKHFINQASMKLKQLTNDLLSVFGPIPALIEKRSGRHRLQLIIQSSNRNNLHKYLDEWLLQLESIKLSKKVRWSLDVDPQDMA